MPEIYRPERWTPRGYLLYLLPLPLVLAAMFSLVRGDLARLLADLGALALLYGGAWLTRQGIKQERDPRRRFAQRPPLKALGALALAGGAFVASHFIVGRSPAFAAVIAALAGCGSLLAYGLDARRPRPVLAPGSDYTAAEADAMLQEAAGRASGLEGAAAAIRDSELAGRLRHIAGLTREILVALEQDPRDLRRARKFLNVYLDGALRVAQSYARAHAQAPSAELEERFRNVLVTIERVFGEQQQKLLANDMLDLDVQIEVLKTQLEKEGVA